MYKSHLISGVLDSNGVFTLDSVHYITNGRLKSAVADGDLSIQAVDKNGVTLSALPQTSVGMALGTSSEVTNDIGEIPTDQIPVVVEIPYNPAARMIKIQLNGRVITNISPQTETITALINAIPDNAFIFSPHASRRVLLETASFLQRELTHSNDQQAAALVEDLLIGIAIGTKNQFTITDGSGFNKEKVLSTLKMIASDLRK